MLTLGANMTEVSSKVECIHCGAVLPDDHTSPCAECGQKGRRISVNIAENISVADRLTRETRTEFYEKKPLALAAVIGITLGAPFVGLVLVGWVGVIMGLVLGAAAYWIGPFAITKVREIERGG